MMSQAQVDDVIQAAKNGCKNTGRGLTKNRQRILEMLIEAQGPMSAYELRDEYNDTGHSPIVAMSVYRILEFFESVKLIHRLKSANKYIACNSLAGVCNHHTSIFLICKSCQRVEELDAEDNILRLIRSQIEALGFSARNSQLEVAALCSGCEQKQHSK